VTSAGANLPDIAAAAIEAARDAGRLIQEVRASSAIGVHEKSDASPVTVADHRSDELLKRRLGALVPEAAWLSEETVDDAARLRKRDVWIVDPLDGTKEFISGVPQYSVAIALIHEGEPLLGIVHNPTTGDVYSAIRGDGARKNGVAVRVAEHGAMLASRSEVKRGEFDQFSDWSIEAIGSIALKLALVASGSGSVTLSRGP
jgi:myo-inositol-1(or 4)-monophosphatase